MEFDGGEVVAAGGLGVEERCDIGVERIGGYCGHFVVWWLVSAGGEIVVTGEGLVVLAGHRESIVNSLRRGLKKRRGKGEVIRSVQRADGQPVAAAALDLSHCVRRREHEVWLGGWWIRTLRVAAKGHIPLPHQIGKYK